MGRLRGSVQRLQRLVLFATNTDPIEQDCHAACARMSFTTTPAMNTAANPPIEPATSAPRTPSMQSTRLPHPPPPPPLAAAASAHLPTSLLLNIGHAFDHMFLLIFATAVATIAVDFGLDRWESLMPYSVGAFFLFGIGSLPAGPARRPVGPAGDDDHLLHRHRRRGARSCEPGAGAVAAGGGADGDRPVRLDLPSGRHSDAGAECARSPAGRSASTAWPATSASRSPRW